MNKDNLLFGVGGLLLGLIIGFMGTNSLNKGAISPSTAASDIKLNSNVPPGHPDISGGQNSLSGGMQPDIQAAIEKAKRSPDDFDAQIKAGEAYYQIEKFDDAVGFYTRANQLKPDDREVIVQLGNVNFDGNRLDEAEKWYLKALAKKADDVNVRTDLGLTFVFRDPPNYDRAIQEFTRSLEIDPNHTQTLQNLTVAYSKKGDAAKAASTLSKLEAVDPSNAALAKLKETVAKMPSK